MHVSIYDKLSKVNAIVHTHSPYTLAAAISIDEFQHIIEEAKIVVGNPAIIANKPSGSLELEKPF
jgi:L-fuculose-phosphate aldolase